MFNPTNTAARLAAEYEISQPLAELIFNLTAIYLGWGKDNDRFIRILAVITLNLSDLTGVSMAKIGEVVKASNEIWVIEFLRAKGEGDARGAANES